MRPGFYIHKDAMDLYIEVLKVRYQDSKRIIMFVTWWNMGFTGNPWPVLNRQEITLTPEQAKEWKFFWPPRDIKEFRKKQQQNQLVG